MPLSSKIHPAFLSLRHASFRLGDRLVFGDTSWNFQEGEHWAILGGNGSGKSLLADAIRGHLPLVKGELSYGFKAFAGMMPDECVGHVSFQERKSLAGELAVQSRWNSFEQAGGTKTRDYLSYEAVMEINPFEQTDRHGRGKRLFEIRRNRAIRLLKIERFQERSVLSLSNGERQRVEIARALCLPLRLLVLDEPTIGLDLESRCELNGLLERLMRSSLRMIISTSRSEDLPKGITHALWIEDCKVVASGTHRVMERSGYLDPSGKGARGMAHSKTWSTRRGPVCDASTAERGRPRRQQRPNPYITIKKNHEAELIRMRDVTVRYGSATLLTGINWSVKEGESWALVGPNGSGKTTLLSLIIGDNPQAYSNEVIVFGKQRGTGESIWELKQDIGWVSPELQAHFDENFSCLEVVESGFQDTVGLYAEVTTAERRQAMKWLRRFGLSKLSNQPLFELSSGLQRMVLLARALVKQPKLLVLDEPCQGLDAEHRQLFMDALDALLRGGKETAIYVTHRPDEIPLCIRNVLRLKLGRQMKRH